ncbi:MAG: aminoacyl-histidine dipeptidase [Halioglobus sp.]
MKPTDFPSDPPHLWDHFYAITQIPRPSGKEAAIRQYLIDLATAQSHAWRTDSVGNLRVDVTGSPGREDRERVIIQNHLDMVTVKRADRQHDFDTDPLSLQVRDGWLSADGTTLGADNGVGCAAAMALMTDNTVEHPPLALLFTVDEETGLNGALQLDPALLEGARMLNLDTEDWQELFVGCAGGGGWKLRRHFSLQPATGSAEHWQLTLGGLAGGHSGIQIHEQLGNAIKILAQALLELPGLSLAGAEAGVAHNVIPREGSVHVALPAESAALLRERLAGLQQQLREFLPAADQGLQLDLQPASPRAVLSERDSALVLDLIAAFPHGALAYNAQSPADLVDLSINLAVLRLSEGELFLEASYRFFNEAQSLPLQQSVRALARTFELEVETVQGYPGWQPDFDSDLLARARKLHQQLFGVDPAVKAIHAGLECGILKSKRPELDILSFGPTIRGAHSPAERLQIDTVAPFWQFLTALLAEL